MEFKDFVETNSPDLKEKKIAMYCTGGIRCEISSSFLIDQGFKNVFQLKGGILGYLNYKKNINSKWKGDCFVFDACGFCVGFDEPNHKGCGCLQ